MALFTLPILVLLLLLVVILLLFKRWKLATITFTALLLHNWYWQVCPIHVFKTPIDNNRQTIRVVTYNIYPQVDSTQYDRWQKDMIAEIKRLNADILLLQEFDYLKFPWLESEIKKIYNISDEEFERQRVLRGRIYSRYPITSIRKYAPTVQMDTLSFGEKYKKTIQSRNITQPFISAVVHLNAQDSIVVFNCHLQSCGYSSIRQEMGASKSWISGIGNYIEAIDHADVIRQWEARNIRHYVDSFCSNKPLIIAGDFNDFNASECLNIIQGADLSDAWWRGGTGLGLTYYGYNLTFRLDHILYRESKLQLINVEVNNSELSDHRAMIADFQFK